MITVLFIITRFLEVENYWIYDPTNEDIEYIDLKHRLGFDLPLILQYFKFLADLLVGNWGNSRSYALTIGLRSKPVVKIIAESLPITIDIVFFSLALTSIIGMFSGIRSKYKSRGNITRRISLISKATPIFFLGFLMKYFFTTDGIIPIFPNSLYEETQSPPLITGFILIDSIMSLQFNLTIRYLMNILLPIISLTLINTMTISWESRKSIINILEQDYIRTAKLKGVDEKIVLRKHVLRNYVLPSIKMIKFNLLSLFTGCIFVEYVFNQKGLGYILFKSLKYGDYFLYVGTFFTYVLIIAIFNLVADLIHCYLNPSIMYQKRKISFITHKINKNFSYSSKKTVQ
jgi:peptide/nickel transport system permease protein